MVLMFGLLIRVTKNEVLELGSCVEELILLGWCG